MISTDQDNVTKAAREATDEPAPLPPLDLAKLSPSEILALKAPNYYVAGRMDIPLYERANKIEAAQEQVQDEIAYARVLARRGALPDAEWPLVGDPRRDAWREVVWERAREAGRDVVAALPQEGYLGKSPTVPTAAARLVALASIERAREVLELLAQGDEYHEEVSL